MSCARCTRQGNACCSCPRGTAGLSSLSGGSRALQALTPCPAGPNPGAGERREAGLLALSRRPELTQLNCLCRSTLRAGRLWFCCRRGAPDSAPQPGPRSFSRDRGRGRVPEAPPHLAHLPSPEIRRSRGSACANATVQPLLSCLRVPSNHSGSGLPPPIVLYFSFLSLKRTLTAVVYTPKLSPPSTLQPPRPVLSREKVPKSCSVV